MDNKDRSSNNGDGQNGCFTAVTDWANLAEQIRLRIRQLEAYAAQSQSAASMASDMHDAEMALNDLETRMDFLETTADGMFQQVGEINRQMERMKREDANKIRRLCIKLQELQEENRHRDELLRLKQLRLEGSERAKYDGILLWKICGVRQKLIDARSGTASSFDSPPFYTSRTGYKMCARIYLNGDGMGKGTHVSLFFVVMRGHYDGQLKWPFCHKVTFMLLDKNNREHVIDRPDPTSSSFQRPTSDMNIASGCSLFVPICKLQSTRHTYVRNDAIFIKVIVEEL